MKLKIYINYIVETLNKIQLYNIIGTIVVDIFKTYVLIPW